MSKRYRAFSSEFKRDLVSEIDSGQITVAEASRRHEISRSLIDRWVKQIHEGTFNDKPSAREKQLEKELEKALTKIGALTMANDFLKKIQKTSQSTKKSSGSVVTIASLVSQSKKVAK